MAQAPSFEDNPILAKFLGDFAKVAETRFRQSARAADLELTGELISSIRAGAVERGKGYIQGSVLFSELLRIKDMKTLRYTTVPPLSAMVRFVEKVGVRHFDVPGYEAGRTPRTEHASILRVARALQYRFRREPNIKRGYRGIYNDELKYQLIPLFRESMHQAAMAWAAQEFRKIFAPTDFMPGTGGSLLSWTNTYKGGKVDQSKLRYTFPV
ncbi:hypothetical protein [Siphonobacter aquaeclarae]|uniref:Uncharacterized protein n=1 Tax=Siphonobacter aquaeclarae TaxID=563176 RepID=A0A1G9T0W3_9BACT|nr:hypothetical protein [Siphonobacter aquaeclarae]SDM41373.1 hypothetical protein SAMN04488090_3371 [Siphonobacter aquaeclarae]